MKLKASLKESGSQFCGGFKENNQNLPTSFNELFANLIGDYNKLKNRPSINGILLEGNVSLEDIGLTNILYDTTENWNIQRDLIGELGTVYVYSDHSTIEVDGETRYVPGIKVGDGSAYLIDAPFLGDDLAQQLMEHVTNMSVHINDEERELWNHKVSCFLDFDNLENLIFSKTKYVINGDVYNG